MLKTWNLIAQPWFCCSNLFFQRKCWYFFGLHNLFSSQDGVWRCHQLRALVTSTSETGRNTSKKKVETIVKVHDQTTPVQGFNLLNFFKTSKPNLRKATLHDVWPLKLNALKRQSLKLPAMSESMIWSSSCTFQSVKISIPSQSPDCCQSFLTHHHLKTTEFRSGKGHKNSTQPFMEGILNDLKCIYHVNHGIHSSQPVHPRGTHTTCIKIWVSSCQGSNRDLHPPLGPLPDVIVHVSWRFEATGC